ncbi:MAG: GAF domain-containing protein, partial [Calditrichaeota bacterium]
EILPVFFDDLKRLEHDYGNAIEVEIKDFESTIRTKTGEAILCSWHARPLMDSQNRRVGAMALGRDITEYKRLQNELEDYAKNLETKVKQRTIELQAKVEQLAKLLEIGEEIRLNVDIDVVVNKICEAVKSLGWRKVIISLRDFETQTSRAVATAGLTPDKVEEVMGWGEIPFEHTEKYLKEAFRVSNSYFIPQEANLLAEDTPYSIYTDLGEASPGQWQSLDALLVPIRTKDRILGVISVDDPVDRRRPDVNRIRDLEVFADKAALAIENAHLWNVHKENERRAKLLAEMSQLFHASLDMHEVLEAIVHKGGKVLGDFCSLLLLDEKGEGLEPQTTYHKNPRMVDYFMKGLEAHPCKAGEGFIGQVVATGKPFLDSHPFPQIKGGFADTPFAKLHEFSPISSVIVVPLRIRGRIIGVMTYLYCDVNRRYKADGLKLAQEMADRAALAIE